MWARWRCDLLGTRLEWYAGHCVLLSKASAGIPVFSSSCSTLGPSLTVSALPFQPPRVEQKFGILGVSEVSPRVFVLSAWFSRITLCHLLQCRSPGTSLVVQRLDSKLPMQEPGD